MSQDALPMFRIGTVERLTGISPDRIRYFEKIGLIGKVARASAVDAEAPQRLYSPEQVRLIRRIGNMVRDGISPAAIKAMLATEREGLGL